MQRIEVPTRNEEAEQTESRRGKTWLEYHEKELTSNIYITNREEGVIQEDQEADDR